MDKEGDVEASSDPVHRNGVADEGVAATDR